MTKSKEQQREEAAMILSTVIQCGIEDMISITGLNKMLREAGSPISIAYKDE